jgi:hypothetical protein
MFRKSSKISDSMTMVNCLGCRHHKLEQLHRSRLRVEKKGKVSEVLRNFMMLRDPISSGS